MPQSDFTCTTVPLSPLSPDTQPTAANRARFVLLGSVVAMAMLFAQTALAETYKWTDSNGNISFTDNPAAIPGKYQGKTTTDADITLADPEVAREVAEGRRIAARLERETRARLRQTRMKESAEESSRKWAESRAHTEKLSAQAAADSTRVVKKRRFT